jgi:ABC-type polysaccharide/polyol phosphate export permease
MATRSEPADPGAPLPETVVTAAGQGSSAQAWRELWAARDVVRAFTVRSLRVRYRQAVLGVAWAVIQPVALLVPLVVFLRGNTSVADYAPGALAALVAWQFVSSAVVSGAGALVTEAPLVRKTWFPREAPVVAAVGASVVELGVGLVLFAVAGPVLGARLGHDAGLHLVALPLVLAVTVLVALAVAVPLAAANAVFRDVRHALPFATLLWLFVSPVAFRVERVAPRWRVPYAIVNPAVGPLDGFRRVLADGRWPNVALLGASGASAALVGWFGHRRFVRLAPTLPDVV